MTREEIEYEELLLGLKWHVQFAKERIEKLDREIVRKQRARDAYADELRKTEERLQQLANENAERGQI